MGSEATVLSLDGERLRVPVSAFEHAGFRTWLMSEEVPEGVRATFVAGEVLIDMTPESIESHNKVKCAITAALGRLVVDADLGELYVDGAMLSHEEAGISTEPDLTFASWATLESGRLRLNPRANREDEFIELEGTPDLAVEVVSDSSVRKDLRLLRAAYAAAGVDEYWLVDARGERIAFEILALTPGGYEPRPPAGGFRESRVLGRRFRLRRERNRVGRWTYRLEIRPEK